MTHGGGTRGAVATVATDQRNCKHTGTARRSIGLSRARTGLGRHRSALGQLLKALLVWLLFLYGALDSHPFFPSHVASGRCVLSAAAAGAPAAGAPAGAVSAFAEPSGWCAGAVLNVAWCAVCASAALSPLQCRSMLHPYSRDNNFYAPGLP